MSIFENWHYNEEKLISNKCKHQQVVIMYMAILKKVGFHAFDK